MQHQFNLDLSEEFSLCSSSHKFDRRHKMLEHVDNKSRSLNSVKLTKLLIVRIDIFMDRGSPDY
jgi:hypothetical protein